MTFIDERVCTEMSSILLDRRPSHLEEDGAFSQQVCEGKLPPRSKTMSSALVAVTPIPHAASMSVEAANSAQDG